SEGIDGRDRYAGPDHGDLEVVVDLVRACRNVRSPAGVAVVVAVRPANGVGVGRRAGDASPNRLPLPASTSRNVADDLARPAGGVALIDVGVPVEDEPDPVG